MRLLVVEDNEELSELLRKGLESEGFAIDQAETAEDASSALKDARYAAVILDLGLPDRDGASVLREMRGRKDGTPVLVLTALVQASRAARTTTWSSPSTSRSWWRG